MADDRSLKTSNSQKLYERAQQVMVGGVNSPVRCFKGVGGNPLVMKSASRATLVDQDNNEFTDYCLSWGSLITGHANRNVVLQSKKLIERGVSFGASTRAEIEIAEFIVENVPSIEKVRFVNSGTEGTMSALRLARGYTRRSKIIKFDGCYHGHVDDLLTTAGSGVAALAESSSAGIPQSHISNTISLPYNDCEAVRKVMQEQGEDIAAIILEPVAGNMGVIPGTREFLRLLRELTENHGSLLIFDECMSGFRPGRGGVQADVGVTPDLTCLGKIIGGGFPIGAYGGRAKIMEHLAPLGPVYQAGTFSGTPVVMRAGLAQLKQLNDDFYQALNNRCHEFATDLNAFFQSEGIGVHLSVYFSMMSLRFSADPVYNYQDAQAAQGHERYAELFHYLLQKGIYWPPADLEAFFVSSVHSKRDLQNLAHALKEFFRQ